MLGSIRLGALMAATHSRYPIGSTWRRWDLHVHTPESVLRDHPPTWEAYLAALEAAPPDVVAIGATDYMSIKGYERLKKEKEAGRLKNIELIVPNVELRITPHTKVGKGINLHVLFDTSAPDHVELIKTKLSQLLYAYGETYGCDEASLKRLGRKVKPDCASDEAAYKVGLENFRPPIDDILKWLRDPWTSANSIIVVDNGSEDGPSNLQSDDGYKAERNKFYQIADAIFSQRPKDIAYFLGKGVDKADVVMLHYGGLKACIWGSDTFDPAKMFKPQNDRFCWIKADPTFNGLRQIIHEPEERVQIGPIFPEERDENRIITRLSISGSKPGWLGLDEVPLNPGLVAIIGNKGTGKTALVDLIAHATGSWDANAKESFIRKSGMKGVSITVDWKAGSPSNAVVGASYVSKDQRTKYLSQQFVEDLCANNMVGEKLRAEIEGVIFQHLAQDAQLGTSSFTDLRSKRTDIIREDRKAHLEAINAALTSYVELGERISSLADKQQRIERLIEERTGLLAQIPVLDSAEEQANAKALSEARDKLAALEKEIANLTARDHDLATLNSKVLRFQKSMDIFYAEVVEELKSHGVTAETLAAYKPAFAADTNAPIATKSAEYQAQVKAKRGSEDDAPGTQTVQGIKKEIKALEDKSNVDAETKKRIETLQQRIREINSDLEALKKEVAEISDVHIPAQKARLDMAHSEYIAALKTFEAERDVLSILHAPLTERLSKAGASERRLEFIIDRQVDIAAWSERGEDLIDHTKRGPFKQYGTVKERAEALLLPHLQSGDGAKVVEGLQALVEEFHKDGGAVEGQLKSSISMVDFLQWLYSFTHIKLTYGIRYNGIGLGQLSPGTKGLVLLMLYLEMDENDRRPLLVDQPEENLDNDSIYKSLRGYFRKAKRRRQIILVTHNPNLVVNTDADQVIVAQATESDASPFPQLSYTSGSLENSNPPDMPGIREQVCTILEGGADAFRSRERRYATKRQ